MYTYLFFIQEAYKQWLCATQLPLYVMRNDSNETIRTKPCLSVCHKVLQRCPYYLPSKFQHSGIFASQEKHLKVVTQRIPCSSGNFHVCNSCGKNFHVGLHLERGGGVAFSPLGAYKSKVHYQYL